MKLCKFALTAAFGLLVTAASAHASTITYTLTNVGLTYGVGGAADGTLNGSFTINTANPVATQLTSLNITASSATGAHSGGGFNYIFGGGSANATVIASTATDLELSAGGGFDILNLVFNSPLGSGTDAFNANTAETEANTIGVRNIGSGFSATVGAAAAPEPSSIFLLGTGLASLGGLIRRRRAGSSIA
jgi:hypothetical protein